MASPLHESPGQLKQVAPCARFMRAYDELVEPGPPRIEIFYREPLPWCWLRKCGAAGNEAGEEQGQGLRHCRYCLNRSKIIFWKNNTKKAFVVHSSSHSGDRCRMLGPDPRDDEN